MNLDPFQVIGAEFLSRGRARGALLADEPGLGKTRQAIAAALKFCHDETALVGVVCPASAKGVWRREIKACPAGLWFVVSYEKAAELQALGFLHVLIIDEAHKLKTRDSKRTQIVFGEKCDGVGGLVERAKRVLLLTGTPTPNNPSEIWPMARACFPAAIEYEPVPDPMKPGRGPAPLRPMSYWQFVAKFCKVKENYLGHQQIVGGKNLEELRERLAPFVLRRLKKDVLADLPDSRHSILPIEGKFDAMKCPDEYAAAREALDRDGLAGLRRVANHVATLRRMTGMAKVNGVADWVRDWFDGGGGKLVVFGYSKDVMMALHERFTADGIAHTVGRGVNNAGEVLFQESPPGVCDLFLGQLDADGTAITLTAASTFVFAEFGWVPSDNDQAWQRIHRRGQKNACDVRYATLAGSIDEDIAEALIPKRVVTDRLWNAPVDAFLALL